MQVLVVAVYKSQICSIIEIPMDMNSTEVRTSTYTDFFL